MMKKFFLAIMACLILALVLACSSEKEVEVPVYPPEFNWGIRFEPETLGLNVGSDTSEIRLNWYGNSPSGSTPKVRVVDAAGFEVAMVNATTGAATTGKVWYKAEVTELEPDTPYRYAVSNDGINWSYSYEYRTPTTSKFSFAYVGDPQLTQVATAGQGRQDVNSNVFSSDSTTRQGWKDTMAKIASRSVNFVAFVGDQVDVTNNGDEIEYKYFFEPPELRRIPFSPVVGNHDRHYPFRYHYNIPNELEFDPITLSNNETNEQRRISEAYGHYWYMYNNALFVCLNTSAYPTSTETAVPFIARFKATLQDATTKNAGKYDWIIVQHHKSTASVADHCADTDIQYYVEAGFEELMDEFSVDFVLTGHDHVYARSYVMKAGEPRQTGADSYTNPEGTIYLTATTGSGLKYYEVSTDLPYGNTLIVKNNENYPALVDGLFGSVNYMAGHLPLSNHRYKQNFTPGYGLFEVDGKTVSFKVYDFNSDTPFDSFTVTKSVSKK